MCVSWFGYASVFFLSSLSGGSDMGLAQDWDWDWAGVAMMSWVCNKGGEEESIR